LKRAEIFAREEVVFPREWGAGQWKLLRLSLDGKAKKLKAHEYLVMFRNGLFAILAAWPRDDDSPNPLARLVGQLSTIVREITAHEIDLKVRFPDTLSRRYEFASRAKA